MSSTERPGLRLVLYVLDGAPFRRRTRERSGDPASRVATNTPGLSSAKVERVSDLLMAAVGLWSNWDSVCEKREGGGVSTRSGDDSGGCFRKSWHK